MNFKRGEEVTQAMKKDREQYELQKNFKLAIESLYAIRDFPDDSFIIVEYALKEMGLDENAAAESNSYMQKMFK